MPDPSAAGFVAPMLATAGEAPTGEGWWAEIKWDGIRGVMRIEPDRWRIWTRNGNERSVAWPELDDLAAQLGEVGAVLDGELVVMEDGRPSFGSIQHRMHVTGAADARRLAVERPATYLVFDLLELGGHDTTGLPLTERRRLLESLELDGPAWRVSPVYPDGVADLLAVADAQGLEGIVAKRASSTYRPGRRSADWVKVKVDRRDRFVVGGWFAGTGRRGDSIGALALGQPVDDADPTRLRYVGRVGTGFSDAVLADLRRRLDALADADPFVEGEPGTDLHPVRAELVVEVRYAEWTNEGLLRHPVFLGLGEAIGDTIVDAPGE